MKLEKLKKSIKDVIAKTENDPSIFIDELIGLRVEAAHAMGMLRGYRMAMKDIKQNQDQIICHGSSDEVFDFPIKD